MKTLFTVEVLGTESVAVLLQLKKYKMERKEGFCQVGKKIKEYGSLDFYASELTG